MVDYLVFNLHLCALKFVYSMLELPKVHETLRITSFGSDILVDSEFVLCSFVLRSFSFDFFYLPMVVDFAQRVEDFVGLLVELKHHQAICMDLVDL